MDGQKPYSPVYNPSTNIGKSPVYSPNGIGGRIAAPSPMNAHQSPAYSPSSLAGLNQPIAGSSYLKMMTSPAIHGGRSPHQQYASGQISPPEIMNSETHPGMNQGRGGSPSPAYNPITPAYNGGVSPARSPHAPRGQYQNPRLPQDPHNAAAQNAAYQPQSPNYQQFKK